MEDVKDETVVRQAPGPESESGQAESEPTTPISEEKHNVNRREMAAHLKSPGVQRMEAISSVISTWDRVHMSFSIFLIAYVYGLDGTVRYVYQTTASNDFKDHSLQATINVVRTVIASAAQPTAAKIADVFGRIELIIVAIVFYTVGSIIEAASNDISAFSGGSVLYQIGYTMIQVLLEVIIGDTTSTRSRVFFSYLPAIPFIINTWVSGNITADVLSHTTWRWGIGMFCIIYPVCALPLIASLWWISRKAKKLGKLEGYKTSWQAFEGTWWDFLVELFFLIDVPGIILMIAVLALLLVPLTLAGGVQETWKSAHIIAPLCVGFGCIPFFIAWELYAPHPLFPFRRMMDRAIWAPLGIACLLNFAWTLQGDYLYTVLQVSFNFSVLAATRVSSLYSFASVIAGPIVGGFIWLTRKIKIYIVFGVAIFLSAYGILYHYRGEASPSGRSGMIGGQVLLGIGGGFFPYPTQATIQFHVDHERLAVMTGLYLALYSVGSALGNCVSGAIWTQTLPGQLNKNLGSLNSTLPDYAYASPLTAILEYGIGTPERTGMIAAYNHVQRLLTLTGLCLCVPLFLFTLVLRNPQLNDKQSLEVDVTNGSSDESSDVKLSDEESDPDVATETPESKDPSLPDAGKKKTLWRRFKVEFL